MRSPTVNNDRQCVSFYMDGHMYGVDIHVVKEVNTNTRISPVPLVGDTIRGLVNIRGQIILVVDIAVVFGRRQQVITDESELIILKTGQEIERIRDCDTGYDTRRFGDKQQAFLVERVGDVVTMPASFVEQTPAHLAEKNAQFVEGVYRQDDELITIVNPAEILGAIER